MSAGHIYHYFSNKEAIVTGIVEQYLREMLDLVNRIEEASKTIGLVEAVAAEVERGIATHPIERRNRLDLEILAEASRNPGIATSIQQADRTVRTRLRELLIQLPALKKVTRPELDARISAMTTLFDGFEIRALCHPSMNKTATTKVIQQIFSMLMSE